MLTNPEVKYITAHADGKVQLFSRVPTDFGGDADNFIAERDTQEEIDDLIKRLKSLAR